MPIKIEYATKEEIPAGMAEHYTEKAGKFVLAVEGVEKFVDYDAMRANLKGTLDKERSAREALERKIRVLGDRDPEEVIKQLDELEELRAAQEGAAANSDAKLQAKIAREVNPWKRKAEEAEKAAATALAAKAATDQRYRAEKLESVLAKAAVTAKVRPEALPDVLRYQGDFDLTDDGKVATREGLDADAWLSDMREKRPHWFPQPHGGGAVGGAGAGGPSKNPFDAKGWNLTEAMKLMRADPGKANTWAQLAGFADANAAFAAGGPKK